jgi:bla regulator protein BlaR1
MIAYFPQGMAYWTKERLSGAPDWIMTGTYDIDARVSDAARAAWQKQGLGLDRELLLSAMLQTMLADRYKMVAHRVPGYADGYALVVARRGPRLTKSPPGATLPAVGMKLLDGGIAVGSNRGEPRQWSFHSASMADFLDKLGFFTGHPMVAGLSGHYDFVLRRT